MKSKLLLFALLLMGVSAGAQTPISVSISDDCSHNGMNTTLVLEMVDLGLSVRWANMNIGATYPEDYGNYYAWGEVTTKTYYSWSTYFWCNGSSSSMTKYCTSSSCGTVDNKTTLEPADDAAHVNWGGNWRMPTDEEWTELCTQCTWTWTTQNGVSGYRVTANNGNSIFLPAAGCRDGSGLGFYGSNGRYWSSSLNTSDANGACGVSFWSSSTVNMRYDYIRYCGHSVRPVCP